MSAHLSMKATLGPLCGSLLKGGSLQCGIAEGKEKVVPTKSPALSTRGVCCRGRISRLKYNWAGLHPQRNAIPVKSHGTMCLQHNNPRTCRVVHA